MPNCSTASRCARWCRLDFDNARFPIQGGLLQRRGGTVRHDAVAWGYARAADPRGVDIIQNCEVTGIRVEDGRVVGVETTRGLHRREEGRRSPCAGNSSRVAAMAGLRLPIESHVLQAFVSEGVKPLIDTVITFGAGHFYISQSDKGGLVFGGDIDGYNSYAQRGNLPVVEDVVRGRHGADARARPPARPAQLGRPHGHVDGRLADHRPDARSTGSISTPAGAMAASRRRRPRAGASPTPSPATSRTRCNAAYRLDRFATGPPDRREGRRARSPTCTEADDMRIPCPYCGERGNEEFTYLGDATVTPAARSRDAASGSRRWVDYVYLRDNPPAPHRELWQHVPAAAPGWW